MSNLKCFAASNDLSSFSDLSNNSSNLDLNGQNLDVRLEKFFENISQDNKNSSESQNEYQNEGGDALNELMKSIIKMRTFDNKLHGLKGNYEIVDETYGRLEENGAVNRIRLVAQREEDGAYDRSLLLEVIPPENKNPFIITFSDDIKGFESSINTYNFISHGKSEILLTVNSGKWGKRFLIISLNNKQGQIIFDSHAEKIPNVIGKFFHNYIAEIIVLDPGNKVIERALIDLSARENTYEKRLIYNAGVLRSEVNIWLDKYSKFEPRDVDYDGIFEIREIMDFSGLGRTDRVAFVEASLKFNADDNKNDKSDKNNKIGKWTILESWIAPANDLGKKPLPQRIK